MSPALRDGLHVALNRPRVFAFTGGTLLLDVLIRLALAVVHPALAILCPPVIALPVLGAAAPTVRVAVTTPDATLQWTVTEMLRKRGPQLLLVAIGGHLVALALGASAFLLVDTALRMGVYATGGSISEAAIHVTPLVGVSAGTLVAFGLLAPAVERIVSGDGVRAAIVAPLGLLADRRRIASVLCLHATCVLVAASVFAVCLVLASERYATQGAALLAFFTMVAVVVGTLTLLGVFVYPIHLALSASYTGGMLVLPGRRIALTLLLVVGLVVGASAIRVTETRPTTATTVSPSGTGDATATYAAFLNRTVVADHRIVVHEGAGDEPVVATTIVERSSRQYWVSLRTGDQPHIAYADSGVAYRFHGFSPDLFSLGERRIDDGRARALPGYWQVTDDYTGTGGYNGLPEARTGTWMVREVENGTQVLELTGDAAVFDALQSADVENVSAETAWVRMRVDSDSGVILGGQARLNATVDGTRLVRNVSYTVETGREVDARRPDALGSRSVGEWTWDIFAY